MTSRQPPPGRKRVGVTRALTRDEEAQHRMSETNKGFFARGVCGVPSRPCVPCKNRRRFIVSSPFSIPKAQQFISRHSLYYVLMGENFRGKVRKVRTRAWHSSPSTVAPFTAFHRLPLRPLLVISHITFYLQYFTRYMDGAYVSLCAYLHLFSPFTMQGMQG